MRKLMGERKRGMRHNAVNLGKFREARLECRFPGYDTFICKSNYYVPKAITVKEFYDNQALASFLRIPVYDTEKKFITGYVRRASVLEKVIKGDCSLSAKGVVRPILRFTENAKVSDIWQQMLEKKEHISVVCDEYGCMRGIVTMEDVIETMLGVEIVDECDTTEDMQVLAKGKFSVGEQSSMAGA